MQLLYYYCQTIHYYGKWNRSNGLDNRSVSTILKENGKFNDPNNYDMRYYSNLAVLESSFRGFEWQIDFLSILRLEDNDIFEKLLIVY